ncbi:Pkinase domain-containing protein [Rhizoctonia solani AG-1 IA]|uniref:Pkinase domain-containing protein n=1 Tax=Thanatephorus cucumeris (strain AG1-IA) TaxID=983506 RepID=L8WMD5_THACA|nr:Pkinase domain-containing protein [Rhizoctonia solani AG-1 IA]
MWPVLGKVTNADVWFQFANTALCLLTSFRRDCHPDNWTVYTPPWLCILSLKQCTSLYRPADPIPPQPSPAFRVDAMSSKGGFRQSLRSIFSGSPSASNSDRPPSRGGSRPESTVNLAVPQVNVPQVATQQGVQQDVDMTDGTNSSQSRPASMPVPMPTGTTSTASSRLTPEPSHARRNSHSRTRTSSYVPPVPENENRALSSLATQCALTLSEVTKEIAPIPAIGPLCGCLKQVFQAVERSKVNKYVNLLVDDSQVAHTQTGTNGNYCEVDEQYPNLDEAAAVLQETLNRIEERARYYNEMNELIALVLYQSISDEIRMLFADLDACLSLFNFTAEVAQDQWTGEYQAVQRRESSELQRLRGELEKMNVNFDALRSNQGELLEKTNRMVDALQQVLNDKSMILQDQSTTTVATYVDAQQLVRTILSVTKLQLPPKLLLGKQCNLDAPIPIKTGITCDIYQASFLGGEKVAKKVFRIGMSDKEYVEKYATRFLRIANLWSEFRSDYTLPFYGIGMESFEGDNHFQLYMVSPLMKNFDISFLKQYRNNQGMKRDPPVVHSGMRGDNILITDSEGGILGGFGLTKALESVGNNKIPPAVMTGKTESQRWMAPEMFVDDPPLETPCDVWGWAMAALEIISGSIPYHTHKQAMTIILQISKGPPRREHHAKFEEYAYRPDEMWALLEKCWAMEPSERPSIDEVLVELKRIAKMPEAEGSKSG